VPLIVIDHNQNRNERFFLSQKDVIVVDGNPQDYTHPSGLNTATNYAIKNNYDCIVFVEPDCIFTSRVWYNNIIDALESGYYMSGVIKMPGNPLHPCGSGWILDKIPTTFDVASKKDDIDHPKFNELIDVNDLTLYCRTALTANISAYDRQQLFYHLYWWDVGIRNWFLLALDGKTKQVDGNGFNHFWGSHSSQPLGRDSELVKEHLHKFRKEYKIY
jgi:hypothetical protein